MKRGMGIAIAMGGVTLLASMYLTMRVQDDAKVLINPQEAEQLKGADELLMMQLNGALDAFSKRRDGKTPASAGELVPEFLESFPREAFSRLTTTVSVYDGKGGWIYDGNSFRPNHDQKP